MTLKSSKRITALFLGIALYVSSIVSVGATGNIHPIEIFDKPAAFSREVVIVNDRLLVPGQEFIRLLGGVVSSYDPSESIEFTKGDKKIDMFFGSKIAYVNGKSFHMDVEPSQINGMVMVPCRVLADLLNLKVEWVAKTSTVRIGGAQTIYSQQYNSSPSANNEFKVVIDPGHGGEEPGAVVGNLMEKDLNLDISKRLESFLKENGVRTFMTRTDDSYVGLYERTNYANELDADLFVSIHNNAEYSAVNGSMTLYHPNYMATARKGYNTYTAANNIQKELVNSLGTKDLGLIERPNLAVLRSSNMPAVLVEVGFITNGIERAKLISSSFQEKAAKAIGIGILNTLKS